MRERRVLRKVEAMKISRNEEGISIPKIRGTGRNPGQQLVWEGEGQQTRDMKDTW